MPENAYPYFAGVTPATAEVPPTSGGKYYIPRDVWNQAMDNFTAWKFDVNAGGYELNNISRITFSDGVTVSPSLISSEYDFVAQTPGGSLIVGSNTITLTPVPYGVNAANSNHYLYISGGTGTAEAVLITGGTAVSGAASGTIIVTCAYTHSGAWTIQSATEGVQETIYSAPAPLLVTVGSGIKTLYAPVYCPNPGGGNRYALRGQGRYMTRFQIAASFALTHDGVFFADAEAAPHFADFSVEFTQPDTSTLGSLTQWPAAFYMDAAGRVEIERVLVIAAWRGIVLAGNSGGAVIRDFWCSAFNNGIEIEAAQDTVRIEGYHFWPFGLTSNQMTAFLNYGVGVESLRTDNLAINAMMSIGRWGVRLLAGGSGITFGNIVNSAFDTNSGIYMEAGIISVNACYFSPGTANRAVEMTGGALRLSGCNIFTGVSNTESLIHVNWTNLAASNSLALIGGYILGNSNNISAVESVGPAGSLGHLEVTDNKFFWNPNIAVSRPIIDITGASTRATVTDNYISDKGTGAGTFANINFDSTHRCEQNALNGWAVTYPAGPTGFYEDVAWTAATYNPALADDWVDADAAYPVKYKRDGHRITIRGMMKDGTIADGSVAFILPAGYRPAQVERFAISYDDAGTEKTGALVVSTDGNCSIYGITANTQVSLSGISFETL
jgi:hypothetical protein